MFQRCVGGSSSLKRSNLIRMEKRFFFRDLGIVDANETDILASINNGVYYRSKFLTLSQEMHE